MENVAAFNNELSGLYESKPPISKAKMAAITRAAMRAIKFYKHVVQSVEKFILKCKPEYKVPGLYVIDSIVRQSRHQYGPEKDVFAPRFARNMKETFANLFRCAPEDKSRIIRVLNLWQKNNVFAPDVIQPIFDLADPNHPIYSMQPPGATTSASVTNATANLGVADMSTSQTNGGLNTSGGSMDMNMSGSAVGGSQADDKIPPAGLADLSSVSPHERSRNTNNSLRQLEHKQHSKRSNTNNAPNLASTSKSRELSSKSTLESIKIHHPETYSKYQRSSHDYDYDDIPNNDDDSSDECASPKKSNLLDNNNLKQLLNDPNVLRQLQTLQNFTKFKQEDKQHNLRLQEEAFEKHLQNVLKNSASGSGNQDASEFNKEVEFVSEEQKIEVINLDGNDSRSPTPDRDRYKRRRSRSRSRSRDRGGRNRRGRSRSRSRSRSPRSNRRRTSRERERSTRDKEKDREHERERRRKGLPDIKKDHLSVCSTTLWVGHLSKLVYQEELSDTFGEYGDIVSIDQIVPRGCAFIVMNRRQDAYKAMQGLKNHKLQGRAITISWAAGKGVKSKEWKDFWDLELGVTYIPWNKLDENTDFDTLEEGGMFDEDSMPSWMKEKINKIKSLKEITTEHKTVAPTITGPPPSLPPPSNNPNMMFGIDTTQPPPGPPPSGGPPPMMPMVPGQFSMAPPMAGPPRMLGPPHMGMPMSGLHMPPNIVPPHAMMMMPGFGMGGPGGPPPMGPPHLPPLGGPHGTHPAQFPPPPGGPPPSAMGAPNVTNVSSDDQMDIEMEDEDGAALANSTPGAPGSGNSLNFSQPPPAFGVGPGSNDSSGPGSNDMFSRERNRVGANSRWSSRGAGPEDDASEGRWRENGGPPPQGGPLHNYQDGVPRNPGGPPHRPDFMNDYDKRGMGPRGGPNFNGGGGDFHPNMQNRFNQPTNLMQMRIPPPNAFNQRGGPGGGPPPMFMRGGQGGPGGIGRQQGPGFFNRNNPFDRDPIDGFGGGRGRGRGGGRGIGRGGRGGYAGGVGGPHGGGGNWSDEDVDDGGFKRRVPNRFRDRDDNSERFNMRDNNTRGGRRGPNSGPPRDRNDSDRDNRSGRGLSAGSNPDCRLSHDDNNKKNSSLTDTEEDWDRELEEYEAAKNSENKQETEQQETARNSSSAVDLEENKTSQETNREEPATLPNSDKSADSFEHHENKTTNDEPPRNTTFATPLYDELPPPKANESNAPVHQQYADTTNETKEAEPFRTSPAENTAINTFEEIPQPNISNEPACLPPSMMDEPQRNESSADTQSNSDIVVAKAADDSENRQETDAIPNVTPDAET
ncbi:hypothetical protein DOY81_006833 [Sarcophaga bullata]|nr:hypothetical protein DOY81_006833 [Sarcophaga bullata]